MRDAIADLVSSVDQTQQRALTVMENIFSAARASAVYSEPIRAEGYTVITATEVAAGGGFGFGKGMGSAPATAPATPGADASEGSETAGGGGGGGGGGGSMGRPVALIVIGPTGVEVRPVVDVTKIALAALTAWGAMLPMLIRMGRARAS